MNLEKFTILILFSLLFISLSSINSNSSYQGNIKEISYKKNIIYISLYNQDTDFVLFTNNLLNISKDQPITIFGTKEVYKGEKQIIVNKITK